MLSRDTPEAAAVTDFDELYERYARSIFNLVYRLVGDYEEAADLTSDTFVQALRSFNSFRGEARPYTWLYRIAINHCKNHFRRRDVRRRVHGPSLDDQAAVGDEDRAEREIPDWHAAPQRYAEQRELEQEIERTMAELSPEGRMVVLLRDVHGLSYQEIAEVVGISGDAVKARLHRARAALRKRLAPYLDR